DALGDRACAEAVGELDDATAGGLLQPVVGAAVDVGAVYLQFGEGEVVELHEQRPFLAEVVDRDRDVVQLQLPRDAGGERRVAHQIGGVEFNDQPLERRMPRQLMRQRVDGVAALEEGQR